mmetsp:Transcript_35595/g.84336  ORF Transcript_35595/g.84336 Transcript_35595/m.84336 type:complete len:303 (+) Transcript_35595:1380-2288(+)
MASRSGSCRCSSPTDRRGSATGSSRASTSGPGEASCSRRLGGSSWGWSSSTPTTSSRTLPTRSPSSAPCCWPSPSLGSTPRPGPSWGSPSPSRRSSCTATAAAPCCRWTAAWRRGGRARGRPSCRGPRGRTASPPTMPHTSLPSGATSERAACSSPRLRDRSGRLAAAHSAGSCSCGGCATSWSSPQWAPWCCWESRAPASPCGGRCTPATCCGAARSTAPRAATRRSGGSGAGTPGAPGSSSAKAQALRPHSLAREPLCHRLQKPRARGRADQRPSTGPSSSPLCRWAANPSRPPSTAVSD